MASDDSVRQHAAGCAFRVQSIIFDVLIIGIMGAYLFNCGFLYFHFNEDFIVDLLNMVIMLLIYILLGSGVIQLLVTLGGGVLLALALGPVI